jgi:acyl-CoA thioester hydrolase
MGQAAAAFEIAVTVAPSDIDPPGHVNNVAYLRWVQEAAAEHWRACAPAAERERLVWVVLRHEIDYHKPALAGDVVIARTWVGAATRVRYERHTEILRAGGRALLARARTLWCPLDAKTGKPVALSAEARALFSV